MISRDAAFQIGVGVRSPIGSYGAWLSLDMPPLSLSHSTYEHILSGQPGSTQVGRSGAEEFVPKAVVAGGWSAGGSAPMAVVPGHPAVTRMQTFVQNVAVAAQKSAAGDGSRSIVAVQTAQLRQELAIWRRRWEATVVN
jgi:hypothetical protein